MFYSVDILTYGKMDVLEAFHGLNLHYYNITEDITESKYNSLGVKQMSEMGLMIKTRSRYPSDRITFSLANITKHKIIIIFEIWLYFTGPGDVDVDLILEDSQRNFLSSLI